jgi:hypothetical protein
MLAMASGKPEHAFVKNAWCDTFYVYKSIDQSDEIKKDKYKQVPRKAG